MRQKRFQQAREIFRAALSAVKPEKLVKKCLSFSGRTLTVGGERYHLDAAGNIFVLGAGKAAAGMARGVEDILGEAVRGGIAILPCGIAHSLRRTEVRYASHPVPDRSGTRAAEELMAVARSAGPEDLVIVLLSGGGSALLTAPAPGVSREDLGAINKLLLRSGAAIGEINAVRKHLSRVKGGGLARLAAPARVIGLLLSDVPDDDPAVIASGPAAPDPTTFGDCIEILKRYSLWDEAPDSIRRRLEEGSRGLIPETPKPGDPVFENVRNIVIGNNQMALAGAAAKARDLGYQVIVRPEAVTGDTRAAAAFHCAQVRRLRKNRGPAAKPAALISGGETTVRVTGAGRGGRNQEFVLACAGEIAGWRGVTVLSGGTDGIDGDTLAAGAMADGSTGERGPALGLKMDDFLERNDSYSYFAALGDLLITGPTGTNVMDVHVILVE